MLEELKKKSIKNERVSLIVCVTIAIALIAVFAKETILLIKGPTSFESLTNEDITAGKYVEATVWFSLGCFEEDYTKYKNSNKKTTNWFHYVIQTEDRNNLGYMGIRLPVKEEEPMNLVVDNSFRILMNDYPENYDYEQVYTGAITKMEDVQYKNMLKFFDSTDYSEEELRKYCLPYYIKEGYVVRHQKELVILAEVVGFVLLLFCVFYYLRIRAGKKQRHLVKTIQKDGEGAMEAAQIDYMAGKDFAKDTKIGKLYTYYWRKKCTYAVKNSELVWAYLHKTTHTTNGVKTGTSYEVILYDKDKKAHHIGMNNEASANSILEYLGNTFPHILVGYDDEIYRLFRKDFNTFLDLRYHQAENFSQDQETEAQDNAENLENSEQKPEDDPFGQTASSDDPFESYYARQKEQEKDKRKDD